MKVCCEICSGTNIVKKDGVFVCKDCGVNYSAEEIRKMLNNGASELESDTVTVCFNAADKKDRVNNLIKLANNSYEEQNAEKIFNYVEKIMESDAENAIAWMLRGKGFSLNISMKDAFANMIRSFDKAYEYAKEDKKIEIAKECSNIIVDASYTLIYNAVEKYSSDSRALIYNFSEETITDRLIVNKENYDELANAFKTVLKDVPSRLERVQDISMQENLYESVAKLAIKYASDTVLPIIDGNNNSELLKAQNKNKDKRIEYLKEVNRYTVLFCVSIFVIVINTHELLADEDKWLEIANGLYYCVNTIIEKFLLSEGYNECNFYNRLRSGELGDEFRVLAEVIEKIKKGSKEVTKKINERTVEKTMKELDSEPADKVKEKLLELVKEAIGNKDFEMMGLYSAKLQELDPDDVNTQLMVATAYAGHASSIDSMEEVLERLRVIKPKANEEQLNDIDILLSSSAEILFSTEIYTYAISGEDINTQKDESFEKLENTLLFIMKKMFFEISSDNAKNQFLDSFTTFLVNGLEKAYQSRKATFREYNNRNINSDEERHKKDHDYYLSNLILSAQQEIDLCNEMAEIIEISCYKRRLYDYIVELIDDFEYFIKHLASEEEIPNEYYLKKDPIKKIILSRKDAKISSMNLKSEEIDNQLKNEREKKLKEKSAKSLSVSEQTALPDSEDTVKPASAEKSQSLLYEYPSNKVIFTLNCDEQYTLYSDRLEIEKSQKTKKILKIYEVKKASMFLGHVEIEPKTSESIIISGSAAKAKIDKLIFIECINALIDLKEMTYEEAVQRAGEKWRTLYEKSKKRKRIFLLILAAIAIPLLISGLSFVFNDNDKSSQDSQSASNISDVSFSNDISENENQSQSDDTETIASSETQITTEKETTVTSVTTVTTAPQENVETVISADKSKKTKDAKKNNYEILETNLYVRVDEADSLPLRDAPNRDNSSIILRIPDGTKVDVLGYKDTGSEIWFRLDYQGTKGWARGGMLQPKYIEDIYDDDNELSIPELQNWRNKFTLDWDYEDYYIDQIEFRGTLYYQPDLSSGVQRRFKEPIEIAVIGVRGEWYYVDTYELDLPYLGYGWVHESQIIW